MTDKNLEYIIPLDVTEHLKAKKAVLLMSVRVHITHKSITITVVFSVGYFVR